MKLIEHDKILKQLAEEFNLSLLQVEKAITAPVKFTQEIIRSGNGETILLNTFIKFKPDEHYFKRYVKKADYSGPVRDLQSLFETSESLKRTEGGSGEENGDMPEMPLI